MGWVNDIAIFTLKTASTFQGGATCTAFLSFLVNVETFLNKVVMANSISSLLIEENFKLFSSSHPHPPHPTGAP